MNKITMLRMSVKFLYSNIEGARRFELPASKKKGGLLRRVELHPAEDKISKLRGDISALRQSSINRIRIAPEDGGAVIEFLYQDKVWSHIISKRGEICFIFHRHHIDAAIGFLKSYERSGSSAPNYVELGFAYPLDCDQLWSTYLAIYVPRSAAMQKGNEAWGHDT